MKSYPNNQNSPPLLLASASPRRQEFLNLLGIAFSLRPSQIEEGLKDGEWPEDYVKRIAEAKAKAALQNITANDPPWILAADTIVCIQGKILGKPQNRQQAQEFLHLLSGKKHRVLSAFCLMQNSHRSPLSAHADRIQMVQSEVLFRPLSSKEISTYLDTQEWQDKAGGYGIQNKGAFLIDSVVGSYCNIVGLPLQELLVALKDLNLFPHE
jgi:septum formation protein